MAKTKLEKLQDAYLYAYAPVLLELTRRASLNPMPGREKTNRVNYLYHRKKLADHNSTTVVAPNIDTVYSTAWLDLSKGALKLHKPQLDRYLSIAFLDAYTNCETLIGTGADGQDEQDYIISTGEYDGEIPVGYKHLILPTSKAWVIIRTIIYGPDDYKEVYKIQNELQFEPIDGAVQDEIISEYNDEFAFNPTQKTADLSLKEFFNIFNQLLINNVDKYQPEEIEEWKELGIGPALSFIEDEDTLQLEDDVKNYIKEKTQVGLGKDKVLNGWSYPADALGIYKNNYQYRASVAIHGLGANPLSMCTYPSIYKDIDGEELTGTNSYKIHFEKGQLPPVKENGFWSITLYHTDGRYLVPNEINRYGINDRDSLKENEDGSIDIIIQKDRPEDITNWLPSDEKSFNLVLRIYIPKESVADGTWLPPVVKKVR